MLNKEDYLVIKTLKERGVYLKDIAEELGVHPKTVSRALKREGAPKKKRKRRPGYTGGYTMLRQYIAPKRALRPGKATVRFETKAGKQLQTDWGEIVTTIAGEQTKVYFMVNLLTC